MKKPFALLVSVATLVLALSQPCVCKAQQYPFQDTSLPVSQRVEDLISRLTLDEKIAFLEHQNPAIERLGIKPYSWWNEALHGIARNGVATVYPMPIALAATFNPQMVEEVYSRIADEGVRKHRQSQEAGEYGDNTGITFFTPNINIFRDPRWGRGMETFGEDPYLTAQMGLAAVRGLQGPGAQMRFKAGPTWVWPDTAALHSPYLVSAACLKHLAVHSGPEGLRHQFDARISNRDLWTTYLPAFEYIIKHSDVQQVMCGYNRLNGEPCCTNHHLLVDILRNRWHYDGILVTDCWALNDCWEPDTVIPRHRTHATAAQAAAAAFGSEVDLECGSGLAALKTAVDSGYISEAKIDEHLRRILRTRFRIRPEWFSEYNHGSHGLWTKPEVVARQSLVMLKNNGILPLKDPKRMKQIAIIGPNAADSAMALGNYNGEPPYQKTILKAFEEDKVIPHSILMREKAAFSDAVGHSLRDDLMEYADSAYTYAEVVSGYTSFYLGAKSVCPDVQMKVQFTGSWYDEKEEKAAAEALIALGCDLISQHADSMGAPTACENAGVPTVCYNISTKEACPNTYLVYSRINWKPYFEYLIGQVIAGEPVDKDWVGNMTNEAVMVADLNDAVAAKGTQEVLDQVKAELEAGTRHVFDTAAEGFITVAGAPVAEDWAPTDDAYNPEKDKVVYDGYFHESEFRSAPYFSLEIDGIERLNTKF